MHSVHLHIFVNKYKIKPNYYVSPVAKRVLLCCKQFETVIWSKWPINWKSNLDRQITY